MSYLKEEQAKAEAKAAYPRHFPYFIFDIRPWILFDRFTGEEIRNRLVREKIFARSDYQQLNIPERMLRTNVLDPGMLPRPRVMTVGGISIVLNPSVPDYVVAGFMENVIGTFWVANKYFNKSPAAILTSRIDLEKLVDRDQEHGTDVAPQNMVVMSPPVVICDRMPFWYSLEFSPSYIPPDELRGHVLLDGHMALEVA